MEIKIINPKNKLILSLENGKLVDSDGNIFPIIDGVPRIAELNNYTENFGVQWNKFDKTQLDSNYEGLIFSKQRFFSETHWDQEDLSDKNILEVGSGAGRFSQVVLRDTNAILYSVDYSDAVSANYRNNSHIAPHRFKLFQASIYEMPFPNDSFDKVFCLGVLQHTPDFEASIKALILKTKPEGEIVVDFYPIKGWWTKVNAKYMLRPLTKRISHTVLMSIIERNVDWLIKTHLLFHRYGMKLFTRFLPVCNIKESFPSSLSSAELREWTILDTFDQYSPEHDHPQRIKNVVKMFERNGARVTFAGFEPYGENGLSAVIRAVKKR